MIVVLDGLMFVMVNINEILFKVLKFLLIVTIYQGVNDCLDMSDEINCTSKFC
jgi:hypothetical protein